MSKKVAFILLYGFIIISCNISDSNNQKDTDCITINIDSLETERKGDTTHFSKLFADFSIIPLETKSECTLGNIKDIKIKGDTLYISDHQKKAIYMFNMKGEYLNKIHNVGRGPSEYIKVWDFDVNPKNENVMILDRSSKKVCIYNQKGKFIRDLSLQNYFMNFVYTSNGFYFFRPGPPKSDDKLLFKTDLRGNVKWKRLTNEKHNKGIRPVFTSRVLHKTSSHITVTMLYSDTIYAISDNTINPFITFNLGKYHFSQKEINRILTKPKEQVPREVIDKKNPECFNFLMNYSQNEHLAMMDYNIGIRPNSILYRFKTHQTINTNNIADDMTYVRPELKKIEGPYMVGEFNYRPSRPKYNDIKSLKDIVKKGKLPFKPPVKEKILSYNASDNPLLVVYKIKQ